MGGNRISTSQFEETGYTTQTTPTSSISMYPNPLIDIKERMNIWKDSGPFWNRMSGNAHEKTVENDVQDIYWAQNRKTNMDPNSPKDNYVLHS